MDDLGQICAVALERMTYLDAGRLERALTATLPGQPVRVSDRLHDARQSGVLIDLNGHDCAVMAVDGRLPEPEFEGALSDSALWPQAAAAMARHEAFAILTMVRPARNHREACAQAAMQTRLAAVLCEILPALGAYWPGAAAAVPVRRIRQALGDLNQNKWPADLWIGHEIRGRDGLFLGIRSTGAARFIGIELEIPPRRVDNEAEAVRYLHRALGDLLSRGRKIRDGEPVRMGEREIWHQARFVDHGEVPTAALRELDEPIWGLATTCT